MMGRVDVSFAWNRIELAGVLHIPDSDTTSPAVVMLQGSGPADRDGNGYFPPIRDGFLNRGLAVFSFDKPGCGASTGDWRDYALEGRAAQALTALQAVRELPEIDESLVGVWGQSQGGWLVQMLASRLPDLPFAIANSGPSIGVVDQDLYGCEHEMRADGHAESEIQSALAFVAQLHDAAMRRAGYDEIETQLLQPARGQSWYGYATIDDAQDWELGRKFVLEGYEPLRALSQVQCPFLAVYGGQDVLVPPWLSAQQTSEALAEAENPDATVVVFPTGDHRIQEPTGDFAGGYLDLLADWTARRTSAPSTSIHE